MDESTAANPEELLARLPELPGVYIMRDREGRILYVGKAKRLCRRVASYFHKTPDSVKTQALVQQIASIDHIVAGSESEALLIESNLIKEHLPRYNIQLRDSKRYPWLAVSMGEDFPRFFKTRQNSIQENRYFGPYPSVAVIRNTIALLHRLFRFRYCHKKLRSGTLAPPVCFYAHIKRCPGPCGGHIDTAGYRENIEQALLFLEGKQDDLRAQLENEMRCRAGRLDYEGAAALRDQLAAIAEACQAQAVCRLTGEDLPADIDIAAMAESWMRPSRAATDGDQRGSESRMRPSRAATDGDQRGSESWMRPGGTRAATDGDQRGAESWMRGSESAGIASFAVFEVRGGKLMAQHLYLEENAADKPELFTQFLRQHYSRTSPEWQQEKSAAKYLLLDRKKADGLEADEIDAGEKGADQVCPEERAAKRARTQSEGESLFLGMLLMDSADADPGLRRLARQAEQNAALALEEEMKRRLYSDGLAALQTLLGLPAVPRVIEAFDIANTGGEANVAACVHFKNGRPDKKNYRKFIIKSVQGQDDFASIQEAVGRRYQRLINENAPLPDLVLIDGGRGQLTSACRALAALGQESLPVLALAKEEELLFLPGRDEPIAFDRHHFALRLLQSIRDEVHRYVNSFHAKKRDGARVRSRLEEIAGIGPASRRKLLVHFGSIEGVRAAGEEELAHILGSTVKAQALLRALDENGGEGAPEG